MEKVNIKDLAAVIDDKDLSFEQMRLVIDGFEKGLTNEQLKLFTKFELNKNQISEINEAFKNDLTNEQISVFINFVTSTSFNLNQMREIRYGLENNFSTDQISVYAKPEFNWFQMQQIRFGFLDDLTMEQIKIVANPEFDDDQMKQIISGFINGLTMEQVEVFAKPKFSWEQMDEIKAGFFEGLTIDQVQIYANPQLSWREMSDKREEIKSILLHKPLYLKTWSYAKLNNELDLWRNSYELNAKCKMSIEQAISTNFDGYHLNKGIEEPILAQYGIDRVAYVLANTIQKNDFDGRFSAENKAWAKSIEVIDDCPFENINYRDAFIVQSHPAVLDGFINSVRKIIKELEKKPTLDEQINDAKEQKSIPEKSINPKDKER